jgi:hypothetical protein
MLGQAMQWTQHSTTSDAAPDAIQRTCFCAEPSDAYATRLTDAATSVCRSHSRAPTQFHSVRRVCRDRQTWHREAVCALDHQTRPVLSRVMRLSRYAAPKTPELQHTTDAATVPCTASVAVMSPRLSHPRAQAELGFGVRRRTPRLSPASRASIARFFVMLRRKLVPLDPPFHL